MSTQTETATPVVLTIPFKLTDAKPRTSHLGEVKSDADPKHLGAILVLDNRTLELLGGQTEVTVVISPGAGDPGILVNDKPLAEIVSEQEAERVAAAKAEAEATAKAAAEKAQADAEAAKTAEADKPADEPKSDGDKPAKDAPKDAPKAKPAKPAKS